MASLPGAPFPVHKYTWNKLEKLNFGFSAMDGSSPYLAHLAMRSKFVGNLAGHDRRIHL